MKKVMKTLALALALCMLMSVAAFASSATLTSSDYVINVTVDGAGTADEVALLVTKAGADMAALADSDILYINQMPATAGVAAFGDITIAEIAGVDAVAVYVGSETLSTSGYVTLDSNLKLTNAVTTITVNLSGDVVKVNGIDGKDAVKKGSAVSREFTVTLPDEDPITAAEMKWSLRVQGEDVPYYSDAINIFNTLAGLEAGTASTVRFSFAFNNGFGSEIAAKDVADAFGVFKFTRATAGVEYILTDAVDENYEN